MKPIVSGSSVIYEHDPMLGGMHGGYHMDDMGGPRRYCNRKSATIIIVIAVMNLVHRRLVIRRLV